MIGDGGGIRSETQHNGEPTLAPICVSIIIPAFDEEAGILKVLAAIRKQHVPGCRFEVIVVDDGSHDGTPALLQKFPDLYDKLVTHPKNSGKGAAVISGLKVATGTYVLFQDADLEYSPHCSILPDYGIWRTNRAWKPLFGTQVYASSIFLAQGRESFNHSAFQSSLQHDLHGYL